MMIRKGKQMGKLVVFYGDRCTGKSFKLYNIMVENARKEKSSLILDTNVYAQRIVANNILKLATKEEVKPYIMFHTARKTDEVINIIKMYEEVHGVKSFFIDETYDYQFSEYNDNILLKLKDLASILDVDIYVSQYTPQRMKSWSLSKLKLSESDEATLLTSENGTFCEYVIV